MFSWHKRKLWISTIYFDESTGKTLKAFFEPTGKDNAVKVEAEWKNIKTNAQGYKYAEQDEFSNFQHWPNSYYSAFGNNCHTFSKSMISPRDVPDILGHMVGNDSPKQVKDRWNGRIPVDDKSKLGPHP